MILDGWGIGNHSKSDVIYSTPTPYWDYLIKNYPNSQLQASGENVGLPDGQMGNSEVGHLNIGAGRVVYQCILLLITCLHFVILQKRTDWRKCLSIASWTVVTQTPAAAKVS